MKNLTVQDIKFLAHLASLQLSHEELSEYPLQLSESLDYVHNLNEIDTKNVPDAFFTTDAHNIMEEDVVDESVMLPQEEALKNAKLTKNGYFVVKRIL